MTDAGNNVHIDVAALAKLARLAVSPEELSALEREVPGILSFVAEVSAVSASVQKGTDGTHNVLRDDSEPNESGAYTETLLSAAPERSGNHFKVPQVIKR